MTFTVNDGHGGTDSETITVTVSAPAGLVVLSIEGANRFATAIEISKKAFPTGSEYVIIATGMNWPDALGGSALAGALDAPILLTRQDVLPTEVRDEIVRLGATKAIVLGGTPAVSAAVYNQIDAITNVTVERIFGPTRYETANAVAARTIQVMGNAYDGTAFIATGLNFPDALGASPIAAAFGMPIVLANPASSSIVLPAGVDHAVICGGSNVVSGAIAADLDFKLGAENTERLAGANRYGTAAAVASYGVDLGLGWDGVGIATGTNFPDALSAGPVLGAKGTVLLLVGTTLPSEIAAVLSANRDQIYTVHFFGSTAAVPQSVRNAVRSRLN